MKRREDKLMGFEDANDMPGTPSSPSPRPSSPSSSSPLESTRHSNATDKLNNKGKLVWSIGYFEKAPLLKELERAPTVDEAASAPAAGKTGPEMEMMPGDKGPNPAKSDLPPPAPDVQKTRPDPQWPSGVLSIILHQVS